MKVILLRHGESTANTKGIIDSSLPGAELSPKGIQRVVRGRSNIKELINIGINECHCSPFRRAVDTFAALDLDIPLHVDDRLGELDYGVYNGTIIKEAQGNITKIFQDAASGVSSLQRFGICGENYVELRSRIMACLIGILESKRDVLIISHETILIEIRKTWSFFYGRQDGDYIPIGYVDPICIVYPDKDIENIIRELHRRSSGE